MILLNIHNALLTLLTGFGVVDFQKDKNEISKKCIVIGLEDFNIIYGRKGEVNVPGILFPYILLESRGATLPAQPLSGDSVYTDFELGIKAEDEDVSLYQISKFSDIFWEWVKANKYLKVGTVNNALGITDYDFDMQIGVSKTATIDSRFAIFKGGFIQV